MAQKRRDFLKLSILAALFSSLSKSAIIRQNNPSLKSLKEGFTAPIMKEGMFQNLYGRSGMTTFVDLLKWKLAKNPKKAIKDAETYALEVHPNKALLQKKEDYICWLGHACFLIQINGKKIITDPCLTAPPMMKRLTTLPFKIEDIKPDYVLVSHGHYDHLDADTIKVFSQAKALIPLQMSGLIKEMNPSMQTQEAGWYQEYDIDEDFQIVFLPAHHWHRRGLTDRDEVLWGSFLIKSKNKTIYFAGDTGYSKHFEDIQKTMGEIDIVLLPIGAYDPNWFMKSSHINPHEALRAFKDLDAKELIPMHFGTFDLTDEPLGEPEEIIKKIAKEENLNILSIGNEYLI